jgi:hypothetical protein
MKRFLIVLVFAVSMVVVPSAGAVQLLYPDGSPAEPFQSWANRAAVGMPDGTVTLHFNRADMCPSSDGSGFGVGGCTSGTDWIAFSQTLADCMEWDHDICKEDVLHEIGHINERERLTDEGRTHFAYTNHANPADWSNAALPHDSQPQEMYAKAFAYCAMKLDFRPKGASYREDLAPRKSMDALRRSCKFIRGHKSTYRLRIFRGPSLSYYWES